MTTIQKLRTLARELAGEAWDYDRRRLSAQAYVRREAAKTVMSQADTIQREDAVKMRRRSTPDSTAGPLTDRDSRPEHHHFPPS